ncbi:hypothetical protein FAEPRAM212_02484 [Faecalibacterium prausnitzii M21/2]|uniref:Uncharacterized protein n=1 Tax=Faecalibacterium prausnitzii M21/2 TaxID=411485 RepID=A8SEM2_9FIRM|nr:hypothetical protein FAEPRAM212_02484 [Faecalibacterium prausnitzii M21/2]
MIFVWESFVFPILSGNKAGFCPKKGTESVENAYYGYG